MALGRTFLFSFAAGSAAVLLMAAAARWPQEPGASVTPVRQPATPAKSAAVAQSRPLLEGVAVREQISLADCGIRAKPDTELEGSRTATR
jgi:hypothetical protein